MNHFLLIKSAGHSASGDRMTAQASALALISTGIWPLWMHTRNRKAITAGDLVAVYLAGPASIIATAKVDAIVPWTKAFARSYPLLLDGTPSSVLLLSGGKVLQKPVAVKERLDRLSFVNPESPKWGVAFMGGTRAVNAEDFRTLTVA